MTHAVIVGAGAAGLTAGEALRRAGHAGCITIIGEEVHQPYDRPPLSKQILAGDWETDRIQLRKSEHLEAQSLDFILGDPVTGLDRTAHRLSLGSGSTVDYDKLIIATGVAPRHLPFGRHLAGVHTLKSIDDALALRAAVSSAGRVLVVGAGFLGTEIAATARKLGSEVVVVDPLESPLVRGLGQWMGNLVRDVHTEHGVDIRTGVGLDNFEERDHRLVGANLSDGSHVAADLAVIAIGSAPCVGWLEGSGLAVDDGVVTDQFCLATDTIAAAGDVARFHHRGYGRSLRLEHRMNATEQSQIAAANLLAEPEDRVAFEPIPYFWTDQYEYKIQAYGITPPDAKVEVVSGDVATKSFVATYSVDDQVLGVVGWNSARELRNYRAALATWAHNAI
ncbi:NAD(P)/FAD-dependent oxidoreductase [Rhodococcus sp. NPDC059968]|uniref:NAD(P)/FAD-dependent oxidoreductase n=1 Tax=Rhodococcus sp. NPDC059968 TaxID=3347017 RepID=UPI00366B76B2